jgi:hypothetical protein
MRDSLHRAIIIGMGGELLHRELIREAMLADVLIVHDHPLCTADTLSSFLERDAQQAFPLLDPPVWKLENPHLDMPDYIGHVIIQPPHLCFGMPKWQKREVPGNGKHQKQNTYMPRSKGRSKMQSRSRKKNR